MKWTFVQVVKSLLWCLAKLLMRIFLTYDLCAPINQRHMIFFYNKGSYLITMISLSRLLSWKVVFLNYFLKLLCVYLLLKKLINKKIFSKKKISFVFGKKYVPSILDRKIFFKSCKKFRNVMLFTDYIKFSPQTFDYNIYFVFYFYDCYLLFSYNFLIETFYLSDLIFILLIVIYFI